MLRGILAYLPAIKYSNRCHCEQKVAFARTSTWFKGSYATYPLVNLVPIHHHTTKGLVF